jgi:hypothetical protein
MYYYICIDGNISILQFNTFYNILRYTQFDEKYTHKLFTNKTTVIMIQYIVKFIEIKLFIIFD